MPSTPPGCAGGSATSSPSPATGELYLTELVALARADGRPVATVEVGDDGTLLGINDRAQLADATYRLRERINERHLLDGVTMLDPSTACVDAGVVLAPDVTLEPNVDPARPDDDRGGDDDRLRLAAHRHHRSAATAGSGPACSSRPRSRTTCRSGRSPTSGPARRSGPGAQLGNYAEVKNSRLEAGVQQHHVSYLGDAHVGARTNIGAGTITANYDGTHKHRTTIGEGAFVGVDTMLVAPVEIGDGAKTGAGAVVTHDVPPGKLAVGVPARIREPRPPGRGARPSRTGSEG